MITKECKSCNIVKNIDLFYSRGNRCKDCWFQAAEKRRIERGYTPPKDIPEYKTLKGIKERCRNPNSNGYEHYGGRGISVDERWLGSEGFKNFIEDMGPKPTPQHSIERKDTDGDYEPGNCRWATTKEQQNNKTNNRKIKIGGEELTIAQIADKTGLTHAVVLYRVNVGMTEDKIVSPVHGNSPKYLYRGREYSLVELARETNMCISLLHRRVSYEGMTVEEAISKPIRKHFKYGSV